MKGARTKAEIVRNIYKLRNEAIIEYNSINAVWIDPIEFRELNTPDVFINNRRFMEYTKNEYLAIEQRIKDCIAAAKHIKEK